MSFVTHLVVLLFVDGATVVFKKPKAQSLQIGSGDICQDCSSRIGVGFSI